MKATIAGITYEGTPEEISKFILLEYVKNHNKPIKLGTATEQSAFIDEMKRRQQMSGSGSTDCLPAESYTISN